MTLEFLPFPKIARLRREVIVTEKIDGTNAQVNIRPADELASFEVGIDCQVEVDTNDGLQPAYLRCGSRNRWLPMGGANKDTNYGFGQWVHEHAHELAGLGFGQHFGEWWGYKIQRGYGLAEGDRRFSLFNGTRWDNDSRPACCHVVPVLAIGNPEEGFATASGCLNRLRAEGSKAAPGFMDPEGIIVFHFASGHMYKATLESDQAPKSLVKLAKDAKKVA